MQNHEGLTPVHMACLVGNSMALKSLLNHAHRVVRTQKRQVVNVGSVVVQCQHSVCGKKKVSGWDKVRGMLRGEMNSGLMDFLN